MMRELKLKKCLECNTLVKVMNNGEKLICCNREMIEVKANSTDAAFEKHVPTYEINNNKLEVSVNHVMENDHYIEWISFVTDNKEEFVYLQPGVDAKAEFKYNKGILYAYCNKHGLWEQEIK